MSDKPERMVPRRTASEKHRDVMTPIELLEDAIARAEERVDDAFAMAQAALESLRFEGHPEGSAAIAERIQAVEQAGRTLMGAGAECFGAAGELKAERRRA